MNIALILAGGTGQRMNTKSKPKQFLELHGKPIIVYTLEAFENHEEIDGIVVVCLEEWIPYVERLAQKFYLEKIRAIVPGGETRQESMYFGLCKVKQFCQADDLVLVHDGVRPLIDGETITRNIRGAKKNGNAITTTPVTETVALETETGKIGEVLDRNRCRTAKAPQSFRVGDLLNCHEKARAVNKKDFIDSASLMKHYGHELYAVEGNVENIKITTPMDFYVFRAIVDAKEESQIFGL